MIYDVVYARNHMIGENTKIQSKMMLKVTFGAKERGKEGEKL